MMKNVKKIMALILAVSMITVMALSVSVFAAQSSGTTASITIQTDKTYSGSGAYIYKAYKIFDAQYTSSSATWDQGDKDSGSEFDYGSGTKVAYFMKKDNPWFATVSAMTDKFVVNPAADGSGYTVVLKDGVASTAETAKAIAEVLKASLKSGTSVASGSSYITLTGDYTGIDITAGGGAVNVQPGYYLIVSDKATNLQLVTTNVTMVEKNEYIYDGKVAEEASVGIGDSATYYIKVYLPANIDTSLPVVVHDKLDKELLFNDDVQVYVSTTDPGTTAADYKAKTFGDLPTGMSVAAGNEESNPCTFHINLDTSKIMTESPKVAKYLLFKYSAELLATADTDNDGYANEEYSSYPGYSTTPSNPKVKTYGFEIEKLDDEKEALDGAEFEVYKDWNTSTDKPSGSAYEFFLQSGTYKRVDTYSGTTIDNTKTSTILIDSKTNGDATAVKGFGGGIYYLVETKAPDGYNILEKPVIITITDSGTVSATLDGEAIGDGAYIGVVNKAGSLLPSTGGIGTTIFYVVGAILVIGSGVILVTHRRMKNTAE
jgi:fimbrial isopeptide formation D2 family protein/LPXTG-motif cell wall-anchored protein